MNRRSLAIFTAVVIAAMLVVSAWAWTQLPPDARVPIHWGADGQVNGWADKTVGLLLIPLITIGVGVLFWFIPVIEPRRANLEKSGKAYGAIWISIVLLMAAIQAAIVATAMGTALDMTTLVFLGTGLVFVVIGNYLPKVRSNYLMGIRTPWTLTSERSWDLTHRLGGRLFLLEGIVLIVLGLIRPSPEILLGVLLGGIAPLLFVVFAYSYRVWKDDPDKRTA